MPLVLGPPSVCNKRSLPTSWFPSSSVMTTSGFAWLSGLVLTSAESSAGSSSVWSSTNSALRSHLRLLVYFPHPSTPRRPSLHFFTRSASNHALTPLDRTYLVIVINPSLPTLPTQPHLVLNLLFLPVTMPILLPHCAFHPPVLPNYPPPLNPTAHWRLWQCKFLWARTQL